MLGLDNRINTKADLSEWITYECQKYRGGVLREVIPLSESDILRKHQVLLRKTEYHINSGHKIRTCIYKVWLNKIQNKYSLHVPVNTCGKGLHIMHVGPVLINGRATVGCDCVFHINTAIVAGGTNDDVPQLEDGVIIGVGAVLLGGILIKKNVAIGGNAVVNKSVDEENIAVAGVPARKVSNSGRLNWDKNNEFTNIFSGSEKYEKV